MLDGPVGPARLTVACLDCARFEMSPTNLVAAAASSAPYAMVLGLAAATYATVSPLALAVLAAGVANEGASLALKRALATPRPPARCRALGTCGAAGMPSSHAQNAGFAWSVHAGLASAGLVGVRHARNGGGKARALARPLLPAWWPALESAALAALALLIGWARVELGYHTLDQVVAGWGAGVVAGGATAAGIRWWGRRRRRRQRGGQARGAPPALPPVRTSPLSPARARRPSAAASPRKLASPAASPLPPWRR